MYMYIPLLIFLKFIHVCVRILYPLTNMKVRYSYIVMYTYLRRYVFGHLLLFLSTCNDMYHVCVCTHTCTSYMCTCMCVHHMYPVPKFLYLSYMYCNLEIRVNHVFLFLDQGEDSDSFSISSLTLPLIISIRQLPFSFSSFNL